MVGKTEDNKKLCTSTIQAQVQEIIFLFLGTPIITSVFVVFGAFLHMK